MTRKGNSETSILQRRLLQAAATAATAAVAFLAATALTFLPAGAQEAKRGGTVTLVTPQGFPGLDPALTSLGNGDNLHSLLWNGLTRYDEQNNVLPDLAERWDVIDTHTIVFHLRKGVMFHNGREVLPADVIASIMRVLDPETASPYRDSLKSIATIDQVDDVTIQINLSSPDVTIPASLAPIKIQPPENFADANQNPIGTGPFKFVKYVSGDRLTLARFEDYWDQPKPYPDEFIVQIAKDPITAYNAFKSGQFDLIWQMDFSIVEEVKNNPDMTLIVPQVTSTSLMFGVDTSQPPFDNKIARQALMYATDKQAIIEAAYFGIGYPSPTNSNLVENHWAYHPNLPPREYDIEKARALFREAGIEEGYTLTFNGYDRQDVRTQAEILERSLNEVGIKLEIVLSDIAGWRAVFEKPWPNIVSFKGQVRGWDPAFLLAGLQCNDEQALISYCNEEVDALMEKGRATFDQEERKAIYYKIQEILYDEVPWIVNIHYTPDHAAFSYIKGFYVDGRGQLHLDGVWTEK
jgi:peptide/nickel transport system substrate-binding protein